MNDSSSINSGATGEKEGCGTGNCCSPMNCDWGAITERAKAVLTDPTGVWSAIKADNKSIKEIYISYVIPLSVIGLLCSILGNIISGGSGLLSGIVAGIVLLVVSLALMLLTAHIYKFVAAYFQSSANETDTFKLIAYGGTASMIGKFLTILPVIAPLGILFGLYSLYTLYQGITPMTGISDKRLVYFIACLITSLVVGMVIMAVVTSILGIAAVGGGMML